MDVCRIFLPYGECFCGPCELCEFVLLSLYMGYLLVLLPLRKVSGVLSPTQGYYVEEYADPVQAMYDWFTHDWESGFDRDLGFRLAGDGSVAYELTWFQHQDRLIDLGRYGIPSEAFLHYDFYVVLVDVSAWHVGRFRRLARPKTQEPTSHAPYAQTEPTDRPPPTDQKPHRRHEPTA